MSQSKGQNKGKKDAKDGGQYTVPSGPKCFGCRGFGHVKQECPTYLKATGKSKALAATLSDTKAETEYNDSDYMCKVEFNQPFCWLYSMPNLLVILQLVTLYLGGNHVKVVCERV